MNSQQIQKALKEKGFSFGLIAEQLNVRTSAVSTVASRKTTSLRIGKALSIAVGQPIEKVFPDVPSYQNGISINSKKTREEKGKELSALFEQAQVA